MKTIIYYFTGTGNSLAAAKTLATALGDCECIPIASVAPDRETIVPAAERVGIVCPVYFTGLPVMAASFAERLDLSRSQYVFSVVTMGGSGGSAALRQLDGILTRKGRGLDAGFMVKMPGNYLLMYGPPSGTKREKILAMANETLADIAGVVGRRGKQDLPSSFLAGVAHRLMYPRFASHVHDDDRKFSVNERCTSCGTCAAVCPAKNIELVDGRPVWKHACELCCACIHLCPAQAIQAGKGTEKRGRYRNPAVTVAELKQSTERKA